LTGAGFEVMAAGTACPSVKRREFH